MTRKIKHTAGSRATTIRDVAKRARVSTATVSRVLNHSEKVGDQIRTRVENTMRELEFSPNQMASSLATRRSRCVGLIIPTVCPFVSPLAGEIERVLGAENSHLIVATAPGRGDSIQHVSRFLDQRRCDAAILNPYEIEDQQVLELMDRHPNLVVIHRYIEKHSNRCVLVDNRAGARLATRCLIDFGHREIAVIKGPDTEPESRLRFEAFRETMAEAGLPVDTRLIAEGEFDIDSGQKAMAHLLLRGAKFSALFCFSDEMAMGAIGYLRLIGMRLPQELSVIGFDNFVFTEQMYPRLTTVHQPLSEMGHAAAMRALALCEKQVLPPLESLLPPRLVMRDSVIPHAARGMLREPENAALTVGS